MVDSSILPLELDNVSYEIDGKRLVKNVSCCFEAGRSTLVIGPNGAGKSLFLRLCHGLLQPSSGLLRWRGSDGQTGQRQAMVFQRPVMLRRSVWANVGYALSVKGVSRAEREPIINRVLQCTGLSRFEDIPATRLSFGEQQRLALARVWALSPQVLFLDEPTASLDPPATHQVEQIITAIQSAGTRIIMTSHDLGQVQRLADEVMFLHRGRLLEQTAAEQFFDCPQSDLARAFTRGELLWWHRKNPLHPPGISKEISR
ncbi:ATP-binding cassette domain-containing protein [Motiliproteus sp. MSK22-1]|uniref:ATP-binding cassette domain-containing protein n=1 Tax=Motiliproteus sp. MSK22-1 TaxID=1897630 RepID=UPI00097707AE|nr:ATP-binding cassette domain-containing protein [Motiliproteus sp. MSK22-1]OMH33852.1 ABC transporter ATP-binding protein [Motiliproteus sp. MSK22-1]